MINSERAENITKLKIYQLLRNRRAKILKINETSTNFEFQNGLYIIEDNEIRVNKKNEAELFYFENNPSPINKADLDSSRKHLDNMVNVNFVKQINDIKFSSGLGFLSFLKNPQTIIAIIMGGIILYAFINSGWKL